jgi:hypothetical protein
MQVKRIFVLLIKCGFALLYCVCVWTFFCWAATQAKGGEPIVEPVIIPIVIMGKNYSGMTTPTVTALEYRNCNFSQTAPVLDKGKWVGVRLWPGDDTPRIFIECNLTNAVPPTSSTLTRCNTTLRRSQVATGTTETLVVDSKNVFIPIFADIIYGHTNPVTLKAEYKPSPLEILADPPEGTKYAELKRLVADRETARAEMEAKEAAAKAKVAELEAVK